MNHIIHSFGAILSYLYIARMEIDTANKNFSISLQKLEEDMISWRNVFGFVVLRNNLTIMDQIFTANNTDKNYSFFFDWDDKDIVKIFFWEQILDLEPKRNYMLYIEDSNLSKDLTSWALVDDYWKSSIPFPELDKFYEWNESSQQWFPLNLEEV